MKRFSERVYGAFVKYPEALFVLEAQPREPYIKAHNLHPMRAIHPIVKCEYSDRLLAR